MNNEGDNMKVKTIHVFVFLINVTMAWINMCYFADVIAKNAGGYFVALGVVPFFIGLFTSCLGNLVLGQSVKDGNKANWSMYISGELGEFLPIGYVILVLS